MVFGGRAVPAAMEVTEGGVTIQVPELADGSTGESVFYNPRQELNRDITIAALRTCRERMTGIETYLDANTASGIRGIRAAADGWTVTCVDRDPEATELCRQNFATTGLDGTVLRDDANVVLHSDRFDIIDLDPFGSPIPFADAAVRASNAVLCVTATDTAPLCGAHFTAGIRRYGAIPRNTEYHREVGLRVLLSALCRIAAQHDIAITPLLSHAETHYVRTYLRIDSGAKRADEALSQLGTLYHCTSCLHRETEQERVVTRKERCPNCGDHSLLIGGPFWLGNTHNDSFVSATKERIDDDAGTAEAGRKLLQTIEDELHLPMHFDQHKLCKQWNRTAPSMETFLEDIRAAGYSVSRTHYGGTTFKTDAPVGTIQDATE